MHAAPAPHVAVSEPTAAFPQRGAVRRVLSALLTLSAVSAFAALSAFPAPAAAQDYPARPIRVIVP